MKLINSGDFKISVVEYMHNERKFIGRNTTSLYGK